MNREHGMVSVELALAIALFLLPMGLLVITLPTWPERQTLARAAASEAARTLVLADSWEEGLESATAAVRQSATNHGIDAGDVTLNVEGTLQRGASVTASVTIRMPALVIPGVTAVEAWSWTARHTERVDDYRSLP